MKEFAPFPKIPRLYREIVVTEKIDGTHASLYFDETGPDSLLVGSRTRWITAEADNYGFAAWAGPRRESLFTLLGPGHHFGEWYGVGINRNYGLHERRLALFNAKRWAGVKGEIAAKGLSDLPNVECVPPIAAIVSNAGLVTSLAPMTKATSACPNSELMSSSSNTSS